MSLKKETIERLKKLKIDPEKLKTALNDDKEVEFELPDGELFTEDELISRDNIKIGEGKKEGEKDARKILVTEIGNKVPGLELKGERLGDLVTEISKFANKGGDEKVRTLTEQNSLLLLNQEKLEKEVGEQKGRASAIELDRKIISHFPIGRGSEISDDDRLTLIKSGVTFENVDGKIVAKKGGEVIRNGKTQAPEDIKEVVGQLFIDKPILMGTANKQQGAGGRGKGNDNPGAGGSGSANTLSKAKQAWMQEDPEKNVNTMSPDFMSYVEAIAKEDKSFDYFS